MRHLAVQCASGASGDMLLGALLDLGASLELVRAAVDAVAPEPVTIEVERVRRAGFAALKAHVGTDESHHHRGWRAVRGLIEGAGPALTQGARERALAAFRGLAEAEARAHGVAVDDVHFHEVGALDAIADIVGVCAALDELGVVALHAETVAVGSGSVETSHGRLAVPVPAVVGLFAGTDAVLVPGAVARELCTPTGAALLVSEVRSWGPPPAGRVLAAGAGAGSADHAEAPNVVRAVLLETDEVKAAPVTRTSAVVVSANVDDLDPRLWPLVLDALLAAGADDAWLTPIVMKKGRPAHQVAALCVPEAVAAVRDCLLRETTTIGVRVAGVEKHAAPRTERVVAVHGHRVRVKEAGTGGTRLTRQPEFDDIARVARETGRSAREILQAAHDAAAREDGS
ncbi:nickel pincer cofactor biosynthesis protein LarC [Nocardioides sp. R1-1]|uniref:nickel pincer cofactor biosynthesis protein LarC n=1 Tax=Nocardioides sp. R1-1 TaxID=3383502 RepID=UPI0038CF2DF1